MNAITRRLFAFSRPAVERFPAVAMTYRAFRRMQAIQKTCDEPKLTPMGFRFFGNQVMQDGQFEPVETKLARSLMEKADVFINIGANIGYYCCWALMAGKRVVAFEPIEMNLRYFYRNVKANGWDRKIEIFPMALSREIGVVDVYGGGTAASLVKGWAGAAPEDVTSTPASTLDTVLGTRFEGVPCLILIDVEGAERALLEGAKRFLQGRPKPMWMVEISTTEHQPDGIVVNPDLVSTFQFFWDNGYESWTADQQVRMVNFDEVNLIAQGGRDTLQTHNFLFLERGRKSEILGSR